MAFGGAWTDIFPSLTERLLASPSSIFPTGFMESRDLQNWMHIRTMNHPKRGPEPRRGGLFVEKAPYLDFPLPSTGRGIKGEGWLYPTRASDQRRSSGIFPNGSWKAPCSFWTCSRPMNRSVSEGVAQISKSAVSQASKPACRGLLWRVDRYFPVAHGEASRLTIFHLSPRFMGTDGGGYTQRIPIAPRPPQTMMSPCLTKVLFGFADRYQMWINGSLPINRHDRD